MCNKLFVLIYLVFVPAGCVWAQKKIIPMAYIKGGYYTPLYSSDSQRVYVQPFYIDAYPVTNSDFLIFVEKYPEWRKSKVKKLFADTLYLSYWSSDISVEKKYLHSPVVYVSWYAAKAYCACQGKRLPTTAEWELVAQASQTQMDASKDTLFTKWILSTLSEKAKTQLHDVGMFKNYYGVYDMHGLVWEWTYDFNSALTTGESRGNASLDNTFFCGGGSYSSKDLTNYVAFLRYALRSSLKANYTVQNLGFRCVKNIK